MRGAFTDAKEAKEGRIETADKGTLFLDEIGNLNLQTQQKLLTMIEKRQTQRIGSNVLNNVDVRILAATNANLCKKSVRGEFRQDLFYRLNTIELHLPPLRERGEDIILLAEHFLNIYVWQIQCGERLCLELLPKRNSCSMLGQAMCASCNIASSGLSC